MTKQDILNKLQELENYSIQQTNHSELSSVMNTFENSLNTFLNSIPNSCKEQFKELPVKFCMDYFSDCSCVCRCNYHNRGNAEKSRKNSRRLLLRRISCELF